jgi:hypothetical protein
MEWPATRLPALPIQVRVSEALRPVWVVGVFFSGTLPRAVMAPAEQVPPRRNASVPMPTVVARAGCASCRPDTDEPAAGFAQLLRFFARPFALAIATSDKASRRAQVGTIGAVRTA